MNTPQRPISVTVISWFLIITSAWTLLYTPFSFNNQAAQAMIHAMGVSPLTVLLLSFFGGFVNLTAGVAMLKKLRWGRQFYLIVTPLFLLLTIALYGFKLLAILLMGFVMYAVFFILLTRRPVSDYFSNSIVTPSTSPHVLIEPSGQPPRSGKRIASVFLLVPGGMMLNAWFMMIVPMSHSLFGLIFVSALFGILACAFIVPAIFLWGRKRWAGVLGTLMSSVGGMLLMMSLMFYQFSSMKAFREQFAQIDPGMMEQLTRGSLIFGIASVVIGAMLIILQRTNDKEARAATLIT